MNIIIQSIWDFIRSVFLRLVKDKVITEPDRPTQKYPTPNFVVVPGVRFNKQGRFRTRSGKAKGVLVHYTVSGREARNAEGVLRYLAKRGLGCPVMDAYGTIYIPEGFDPLTDVAWHAGKSHYGGLSGMSRYLVGMEICNWGRLTPESKKRVSKMRRSPGKHNIVAGEYEPFTKEQEEALTGFILWVSKMSPDFDVNFVVGHDEVSPGRKTDPGASLSMSMPEYREYLKRRLMEN